MNPGYFFPGRIVINLMPRPFICGNNPGTPSLKNEKRSRERGRKRMKKVRSSRGSGCLAGGINSNVMLIQFSAVIRS